MDANNNEYIKENYKKYIVDQTKKMNYSEELNTIGLEVGRLSDTKRIHDIDGSLDFDYPSLLALANKNT